MRLKKVELKAILLFLLIFPFLFQSFFVSYSNVSHNYENQEFINLSDEVKDTKQWLNNSNFDSQELWISSESSS